MLVKMAQAIGRVVLAGRELTRLAGYSFSDLMFCQFLIYLDTWINDYFEFLCLIWLLIRGERDADRFCVYFVSVYYNNDYALFKLVLILESTAMVLQIHLQKGPGYSRDQYELKTVRQYTMETG